MHIFSNIPIISKKCLPLYIFFSNMYLDRHWTIYFQYSHAVFRFNWIPGKFNSFNTVETRRFNWRFKQNLLHGSPCKGFIVKWWRYFLCIGISCESWSLYGIITAIFRAEIDLFASVTFYHSLSALKTSGKIGHV